MTAAEWVALAVFTLGVWLVPWIESELAHAAELAERPPVRFITSDDGTLVWLLWPPSDGVYPPLGTPGG